MVRVRGSGSTRTGRAPTRAMAVFVTWKDSDGAEREDEGVGAGADPDDVLDAEVARKFSLERRDGLAENGVLLAKHALYLGTELRPQFGVLLSVVLRRHAIAHRNSPLAARARHAAP